MFTNDAGHDYYLQNIDGPNLQRLVFVKRVGPNYPGNTYPTYEGTTVQEVMRAVIDRLRYANMQTKCLETGMAINHAIAIVTLLEMRAKRVKGKFLDEVYLFQVLDANVCKTCGHISCTEEHSHA